MPSKECLNYLFILLTSTGAAQNISLQNRKKHSVVKTEKSKAQEREI